MSRKLSVNNLLRLACLHCEVSLEMSDSAGDRELAKQVREYRLKRWGMSPEESALVSAHAVAATDVARRGNQTVFAKRERVIKSARR